MTTIRLPRRVVLGAVLSTALVGGGLGAFAATSTGACAPTYKDAAGDAAFLDPGTAPLTGDDDLDIVAVTHSVDGGKFTTSVTVVKLHPEGPAFAFGDRYVTSFTVAGKAVTVTAERDFSGFGKKKASATIAGTAVTFPVTAVEDLKGNTISAVMAVADLEKAMKAPLAGKPFSAMSAVSRAIYPTNATPSVGALWDEAEAAKTSSYTFGKGCGGSKTAAAPAPKPKPTQSASPKPSPKPSSSATPTADMRDPMTSYPATGCVTIKDPKGDAEYNNAPNDPDLDITGYTLRTTDKALVAYIKVDQLGESPSVVPADGHRFYSDFTFNKKVFSVAASSFSSYGQDLRDGASQTGEAGPTSGMSVDGEFTETKVTSKFDVKGSMVVLSVPLADVEKAGKAPLAGATLTKIAARAGADSGVLILPTDTTASAKPENDVYKVGDNKCFAPPPSPLSSVGVTKAQYADMAPVAARLLDSAGKPVAGKSVTFQLGAERAVATTAKNGVARASLLVREKAGRRVLRLTADGQTLAVPFAVLVEKTRLTASASAGAVTATLTDDDRHAVALQLVTFTSGSRKVTARTDASGFAEARGFARGAVVKVSYPGAKGMYSAASTSTSA